jgi:hypothetical protein
MIIILVVSNRAGVRTVLPTAVTSFPRMCIDDVFGWSIESLLFAECCPATSVVIICRACMDDPGARGVFHVLPWTVVAIIKMIPGHLTGKAC